MTLVFTKDGDLVITKNGNHEIDTVPQYFLGRSQNVGKYDENNIGVINSELDYKTSMAKYLGKKRGEYSTTEELEELFIGNEQTIIDCGQLAKSIGNIQIQEMKYLDSPSFIRIKTLEQKETNGITSVIDKVHMRYMVMPDAVDIKDFKDFTVIPPSELKELTESKAIRSSAKLEWIMTTQEQDVSKFSECSQVTTKKIQYKKRTANKVNYNSFNKSISLLFIFVFSRFFI